MTPRRGSSWRRSPTRRPAERDVRAPPAAPSGPRRTGPGPAAAGAPGLSVGWSRLALDGSFHRARVGAGSAVADVDPCITAQVVRSSSPFQGVVPVAAENPVGTLVAAQGVAEPGPRDVLEADQRVRAVAGAGGESGEQAGDPRPSRVLEPRDVPARPAVHRVVRRAAVEVVVATPADDEVAATEAVEVV